MSELVAVKGDENDHGKGDLHASNTDGSMFVEGKEIVLINSTADPDNALHTVPVVNSKTGSLKFFVNGISVHRNNDLRYCLARTVVTNQSKVFSGG